MSITPKLIKELREKTGAGMLDCKKALEEMAGDLEQAVDYLRKKGILKAEKKSSRVASQGLVFATVSADKKTGVVLEFNSETDFVAKNPEFVATGEAICTLALNKDIANVDALLEANLNGETAKTAVTNLIAKIGENMNVRRFSRLESPEGFVTSYVHLGGKIGVLISLKGDLNEANETKAKDVAMHIAAMAPKFARSSEVTTDVMEREMEIERELLIQQGKPEKIIENILNGKKRKFFEENCLLNQVFVKDNTVTVEKYLGNLELIKFERFLLGDGIEKEEVNFAEEVAQQLAASSK